MLNKDIITNYKNLIELRNNNTNQFPAKVSYAIARNARVLQPIVEDIETTRLSIINKYGEPVEDSPGYFSPKEGQEDIMMKELKSLEETETNVELAYISLDFLNLDLSIADMDALYFMISEED